MIRVVVVAQGRALRAGLRAMLAAEGACEVVGEAATLSDLRQLPPADLLLAEGGAMSAPDLRRLLAVAIDPPGLLLLAADATASQLARGMPLRAWGILPPEFTPEELAAATRAVAAGLLVAPPAMLEPLLAQQLSRGPDDSPGSEALTSRELEVLGLVAQGLANKQIAVALEISEHTVKFHVSAIFAKLGAHSRTEAVRLGTRSGLVAL